MELETINKLFLELSQFATAKTKRESELEDLLTSVRAVCAREGKGTHWGRLSNRIGEFGIGTVTAKIFKILPSDPEYADLTNAGEYQFQRCDNGDVLLRCAGKEIRIPKAHWCSDIANMSYYGEENMGFDRAANFHYGATIHESCRLGMKEKRVPEAWKGD